MAPRAVWTALSSVLAALAVCTCGGAGVDTLVITYPKTNTLVHAAAGPGLRGGEVVGGINIGSAAKIGALLYTAVSNDGFAFTASAKYDGSAARGRSFLTVTDFRGAAPKVVKTYQLGGLASGALAGCPLAQQGGIAIETIGVSHHVFLTLACTAKCGGGVDRSLVVKWSWSSASKNLAGPSSMYKWLISSQGCTDGEQARRRRVLKLRSSPKYANGELRNGTLYAVVGGAARGTVVPELYRLEAPPKSNIVTPLGITAGQRFYSGGADCSGGAEVSSATAFYVQCQARCLRTPCPVNVARDLKNAIVYATSGKAAAPLGGGSTAISTAVFGQITAGSASVVYGLQTRPGGTFVISRPKGDLGTTAFTTAFRIGAGASDIDVF